MRPVRNAGEQRSSVDPAFEAVFRAHYAEVVAFAACTTGSRAAGEDIAQEVFASLLRSGQAPELRAPLAWLRTAAHRRALNALRQVHRERGAIARLAEAASSPSEEDAPGSPELGAALWSLSPNQRAAVLLVYGRDVAPVDAARVLGCAPTTLRVHLWRARAALRAVLGDPDETLPTMRPHEELPR